MSSRRRGNGTGNRGRFMAFAHFGINTFTNREWGDGTEDPKLFNPTDFDARQWVRVVKDAGMKTLIVTAKHHDGFCLWPTAETSHGVKSSPWREGKGDVVGDVAAACREAGIGFGVYLSPWDRHEPSYGDSPRYNEYFRSQLRELLTQLRPGGGGLVRRRLRRRAERQAAGIRLGVVLPADPRAPA